MEFIKDSGSVQPPVRTVGVTEALLSQLEDLAVGESGTVKGKLASVRTLLSRHVRRMLGELGGDYPKRFVAREVPGGRIRVWRVA